MESEVYPSGGWQGDALNRQQLAQHLTTSLVSLSNHQAINLHRGLTVSLDGDWGSGKTFFVEKWAADLKSAGFPTIYFDAWKNDIGDEASVALMSAILEGLSDWRAKLPKTQLIIDKAADLTRRSINALRKAVLPASKIIAKGLIKKISGIAVDELADAFGDGNDPIEFIRGTNESVLDGTLDDLFEKILNEHRSRQASLELFRETLSSMLMLFQEHAGAQLPLFIFVDELDRCRPSYAVKLLEEIKHIFGIENVCYVISTNIKQLQESVKGLYGNSFDGARYLKRLFDREYRLPIPNAELHVKSLITPESIISSRKFVLGLPASLIGGSKTVTYVLSVIFDAFDLDLRSQKQVLNLIEDVVSTFPANKPIHLLYLCYLCALNFRNGLYLDEINNTILSEERNFDIKKTLIFDVKISYNKRDANSASSWRNLTPVSVLLSDILEKYIIWSRSTRDKLVDSYNRIDGAKYPDDILNDLIDEVLNRVVENVDRPLSISRYPSTVRHAGFLAPEIVDAN